MRTNELREYLSNDSDCKDTHSLSKYFIYHAKNFENWRELSIFVTMATTTFSLSRKTDKGTGLSQVLVRFVVGSRINQRAKSSIFVPAEYWDQKKQQVKIPKYRLMNQEQRDQIKQLDLANARLQGLRVAISEAFNESDGNLSPGWLVDVVSSYEHPEHFVEAKEPYVLSKAFEDYLAEHKLSEFRVRFAQVVSRAIARFEAYSGRRLEVDTMTADDLRAFETYQREEPEIVKKHPELLKVCPESRPPEARGGNTITGRMKLLRAVVNWAFKQGRSENKPFSRYTIHAAVYGTPFYISVEERNRVYRMNLSRHPELATQRDIFVFQCLVGCRVGDLIKLTKSNVIDNGIEYIPGKTREERGEVVRVPLNSIAREILAKYKDIPGNRLLPFIAPQSYNIAIKRIFLAARLTRPVTILDPKTRQEVQKPLNEVASSHIARRTFIGNLYRQVQDPNLVGKLSGHKEGSRAFVRYRDIDEGIKRDLVKLLEK